MKLYTYTTKDKPAQKSRFQFKNPKTWNWKRIFTWLFRIAACGVLLIAALFLYYSHNLPDPNKLLDRVVPESTKIFARDGSLLYEIHGEYKRTQVNLDQVSPYLKEATIAIEDKDFYHNKGISITGIIRAAIVDVIQRRKAQGASTITQQVVKNTILTKEKSWDRKIKEAILAIAMDARFSKDDILRMYLNEIPYGRNAYGIEAASQTYFGKSAKDLSLAESAYLAALPQAPTYYNPSGPNLDALNARKNLILQQMKDQGYITESQRKAAHDEKVAFSTITSGISAPHFVLWVQDYLAQKYGEKTLEEGGMKVYTTLDPKLQAIAEKAVADGVTNEQKKYNVHNAALVAVDPKTGQILAMVGGKDYFGTSEPAGCTPGASLASGKSCLFEPNVNVATSPRQPGSSFKPYVYGTAFKPQFKYYPAFPLFDVVTDFGPGGNGKDYIPHNYSGNSNGLVNMRKALAGSLNIPAVKTLSLIGVDSAVQTAHDLGITTPLQDCGLSLVLGGCDVKLVDHVAAFSVIANEGVKNEKTPILKIQDKNGKTLEEFNAHPQTVLDPQAAYELISIMTDNNARSFVFGSHSPLILSDRTVAAKTGTTNNWHDGWTVGFTPSLAAGVWAGNNDGTLLTKGADGVFVAAPIWNQFMSEALKGTPAEDFKQPDGITKVTVDRLTGKLPTQFTPSDSLVTDVFASYAVPTDHDAAHVNIAIDSLTGQRATDSTPPEQITYQTFTIVHSEKPTDSRWEGPVQAWAASAGFLPPPDGNAYIPPTPGDSSLSVSITNPAEGSTVPQTSFPVSVAVTASHAVTKVTLSLDGQLVGTSSRAPYIFEINQSLTAGQHTLAAQVMDITGNTADTSITVTAGAAQSNPLIITDPVNGSTVTFPVNIAASSGTLIGDLNFYYQDSKGVAHLIGSPNNISNAGGQFQYTASWTDKPTAGNYQLYAQSSSNKSPKVKIIVP